MTVLKATFRTNDEHGPVEIELVWHKQIPGVYNGPSGYTVNVASQGTVEVADTYYEHDRALACAVRIYKRYEKESNERATAQSKTT